MSRFFNKLEYQSIADKFNLGKIQEIHRFKGGLAAPKAVLKTKRGRFVVSKYTIGSGSNFKNKPGRAIELEINLLNNLKDLPVPQHCKDITGNSLLYYKGYGVTVYKFISGISPKSINSKRAYQLGVFLGKFHRQGLKLKNIFSTRPKLYDLPPGKISKMRPYAHSQKNNSLKSVVGEIESNIKSFSPSKNLPTGPIHVDIKADNELYVGDKLTGIIDFGNFYWGPLMIDVGKTIILNCIRNGLLDDELMKQFLIGYQRYRKLTPSERKYLEKSIIYSISSHIWLDLYHVPLKLVPHTHTLYFVERFLPAARKLYPKS